MTGRADYGIDAPGVIRNLFVLGAVILAAALLTPPFHIGSAYVDPRGFWVTGVTFLLFGALMLLYSFRGKFRHRDRILALAQLRGDESVLDIGTGRGLLLVGAAKWLVNGRAVGLDIWKASDLSGNTKGRTEAMIAQEGVGDRCRLLERPAQNTGLPDASFDVIVSNLCLHNIAKREERNQACKEIVRLLKPGGAAIISDFKHTAQYAKVFHAAGLTVQRSYHPWDTFPPLTIVEARKPKLRV